MKQTDQNPIKSFMYIILVLLAVSMIGSISVLFQKFSLKAVIIALLFIVSFLISLFVSLKINRKYFKTEKTDDERELLENIIEDGKITEDELKKLNKEKDA